jgi:uncharacterized protein YpbB
MINCYCCERKFKRIKFLLQHLSNGGKPKGEIDFYVINNNKEYERSIKHIMKYGIERVVRVILRDRDKKRHIK